MNAPVQARFTGSRRRAMILSSLAILLAITCVLAAGLGALHISPAQCLSILTSRLGLGQPWPFEPRQEAVLWAIRLPRVCLGVAVGASLAVAGASLQGMFRNPLADPGLIGVSSGGALGAATMIVLVPGSLIELPPWVSVISLPLAAFTGGLVATWVVYKLATRDGRTVVSTMLLAGIAVNALAGAAIGFLTVISDDAALRSLTMWSLGSLGAGTWPVLAVVTPVALLGVALLVRDARALNALLLGESEARHLGVSVDALKLRVVALAAMIVGVGVGFTGLIGFVGLVVPHVLRLAFGPDHRVVLPGSALLGGALLLGADLIARTATAPAELPIGVVTSLLGAPFFLWLMLRARPGEVG